MSAERSWCKSSYSDSTGTGNCVELARYWHKASYGDSTTGNCVEFAHCWRKPSYSNDRSGGNCLETATAPGAIRIRDSKTTGSPRQRMAVPAHAWSEFVTHAAT
ncbi:DUF397 domain-containing protein [Streptomyces sp. UNOC14_S4]|uniref:DUF397 domain-containing protein n=1 Tax=Streptomyces sp. UNOC14_S4 TaxID=2872340 RepID=UPI001E46F437|nr:DUF397 domain-containing protein [Streptomyces sp. UNOC14_S4]MCC3766855.1 DUF397 domain-containing protein [Streptomyces sp. UNOC14_S4]